METKDLPMVEPRLTQHGDMHDKIVKNGIRILYEEFKERKCNACTISFIHNDKEVELEVRVISEEPVKERKDVLHLDDIKKAGE